jgi:hypothetical protein
MAGKLITLPLRVWIRSARLLTCAATGTAVRALSLIQHSRAGDAEPRKERGAARAVVPVRPPRPDPPAAQAPADEEQPVHVSAEPELVHESAEPGAEEGAGAVVTVLEPWNGYAHMNAREVIARASQAGSAELAAVRLYESRHRRRQTVLAAVDRQSRSATGRS